MYLDLWKGSGSELVNGTVLFLLGLVLFVAMIGAATRPRGVLYATVFFLPWAGFQLDIGLNVSMYRLLLAPLAAFAAISLLVSRRRTSLGRTGALFLAFLGFSVLWSLIQLPFLPSALVSGGYLRTPVPRAIGQIAVFLLVTSPILVGAAWARTARVSSACVKTYLASLLLLCLIGWFQFLIWRLREINLLPIGVANHLVLGRSAQDAIATIGRRLSLFRMNSLGGEPKTFAQSLALGLILLQAVQVRNYVNPMSRPLNRLWILWAFLFVSLVATLSTAGFYLWIIGSSVLYALNIRSQTRWANLLRLGTWSLAAVTAVSVPLFLFSDLYLRTRMSQSAEVISEVFKVRTVDRSVLEDFDLAVTQFLAHNPLHAPLGVGLGNVHLYANRYLPNYALDYAKDKAFVAKIGLLRFVSEIGVVGVVLFVLWIAKLSGSLLLAEPPPHSDEPGSGWYRLAAQLIIVLAVLSMARSDVTEHAFMIFGLGMGLAGGIRSGEDLDNVNPVVADAPCVASPGS